MPDIVKKIIKRIAWKFNKDIVTRKFESDLWLKNFNIQTILDIGANKGQLAIILHKKIPQAKIYSFEPLKSVYNELLINTKDIPDFKAFNLALGHKNCIKTMNKCTISAGSSILNATNLDKTLFPNQETQSEESIEVRKLDDLSKELDLKGNILVKIDVEGYEDNVIKGGKNILSKAKIIIIETSFSHLFDGQKLFDEIYSELFKLGFKYKGSWDQTLNTINGQPLMQDAIFIKE